MQGRAGDAQHFGDRRFRDRFGQQVLNLSFPPREPGGPEGSTRAAGPPPLGAGRRQALFRPLGNQIPFNFREESKERHHHLRLKVLRAVELDMLFDGDEPHLLLEETVHQLDDLPHTPPEAREFADQQ